ncbi:uncharacterized protein LOC109718195 isoform X2 [Ananas comosus]|uniref:Uncharacterized protein LOC109718195 isoform X2 n=1 Tax=Ananas comosus TaxID=4615 RepID=A0A6P5FU95_ANACO|nr:uncharacterized protein LOC109718195 isoform X2 [Ananas comosus]
MNKSFEPDMLNSSAYQRLRAESPNEFEPKTVFFYREGQDIAIDWQNSFCLKAAVVYHAITRIHVNPQATPKASWLLLQIAKNCRDLAAAAASTAPAATASASTSTSPAKPDEINEEFIRNLPAEEKEFVDGVYLVVGFLPTLKSAVGGKWDREKTSEFYLSMRNHEIVTDIIKIGNQIPLNCIVSVGKHVEEAIKKAKDAFQKLPNADKQKLLSAIDEYKLSFPKDKFHEVLYLFCWYYSPFYYKAAPDAQENVDLLSKVAAEKSNLLECVHEYVMHAWGKQISGDAEGSGYVYSTPTAKRLRRAGVRFTAVDAERSAAFQFTEPALKLPTLMFDFRAETVVKNLLALELLRGDYHKPLTRYFQFMNELVEDIGDIKVLRRAGVIRGGSKAGLEVLEMVKKIDRFATYPSTFAAIDNEIDKARQFHKKQMERFVVRHQPAVLWVSSVAAASVIATAVFASRRRARA